MQDREAFMRRPDKNRNPDGAAFVGNGEQGLYAGDIADADAQAAILLIDFGDPVGIDRLLNADAYTVLVEVEKQQLFQGCTLLRS